MIMQKANTPTIKHIPSETFILCLDDVVGILSWKSKESPEIMKYLLIKSILQSKFKYSQK